MRNFSLKIVLAILVVASGIFFLASCKQENANANKQIFPNGSAGTPITAAATPEPIKVSAPTPADIAAAKKAGTRTATIKTQKGDIVVELYGADAPMTVANFVNLAKAKFYDGLNFHRVEPGFVIQGGDPNGDGTGGPGYTIKLEKSPKLKHGLGSLAMARSKDKDSAGCQFYITLSDNEGVKKLDDPANPYAVFGKVISGMDVANKILKGDKIESITVK